MLPNIVPTSRNFDAGFEYLAQRTWRSSGSSRRHYGEYVQEATLTLEFANIDDDIAREFLVEYEALGLSAEVIIPAGWVEGMGAVIEGQIAMLVPWFFQQPPTVKSVQPNVSTVSFVLQADFLQSNEVLTGEGFRYPESPICGVEG